MLGLFLVEFPFFREETFVCASDDVNKLADYAGEYSANSAGGAPLVSVSASELFEDEEQAHLVIKQIEVI